MLGGGPGNASLEKVNHPEYLAAILLALTPVHAAEWNRLFNGEDLQGWSITLENQQPGEDPEKLVQIHDGTVHMYRDVPAGKKVPFGVITTDESYSDYHLRFEYRWIGKRFEPRAKELRDAGVIYHVQDASKVWPSGPECQVQEGDTGDVVFIRTGGLTWMRPADSPAPDGQGEPGLLPENGGIPRFFEPSWPYIGRFEEADSPSGWNRVDLLVRGDEAVHVVNGRVIARIIGMVGEDGEPLTSGRISFQLEAAEVQYRNIELRPLNESGPEPSARLLSLSAVKGHPSRTATVKVSTPDESLPQPIALRGADADSFEILDRPASLDQPEGEWTVGFRPQRGRGRYSASLELGSPETGEGTTVLLQGIALDAFEGENEPPLQDIVHALGIPLDVGGGKLELDKDAASIGDGIDASYFTAAGVEKIRITPLARFSPPGATPVGLMVRGNEALTEIGRLSDSDDPIDAHQTLLPPWEGGKAAIEIVPPDEPFGFYMEGHHYTSFTDRERPSKASIAHTARIYPVRFFQGKRMTDTWIVAFEEASNGDYQDLVLMVEGIEPLPSE